MQLPVCSISLHSYVGHLASHEGQTKNRNVYNDGSLTLQHFSAKNRILQKARSRWLWWWTSQGPGSQQSMLSFPIYYVEYCCVSVFPHLRGMTVVWLEAERLSAPCRASRSQRDLARTPEMHDGWDRDVWCKLSHLSTGVYHIMRHQSDDETRAALITTQGLFSSCTD